MGFANVASRSILKAVTNLEDARASSPCLRLCTVDEQTGFCVGCGRSVAEIVAWGEMGPAGRRRVLAQLGGRLTQGKQSGL